MGSSNHSHCVLYFNLVNHLLFTQNVHLNMIYDHFDIISITGKSRLVFCMNVILIIVSALSKYSINITFKCDMLWLHQTVTITYIKLLLT